MKVECKLIKNAHRNHIDPNKFREMVADRACFKAEKRGFAAGHEMEDWIEAEWEVSNQCFYWSIDVQ
jgi:hypothetical protein